MSLISDLKDGAKQALQNVQFNQTSTIAELERCLTIPKVRFTLKRGFHIFECSALFNKQRDIIEIQVRHPAIEGKITINKGARDHETKGCRRA